MNAAPVPRRVVVVGASLAGLTAAQALRGIGYDGRITVIGDEPHMPYDRPPLSKQVLRGLYGRDTTLPRQRGLDAEFRLGVPATGLDVAGRALRLGDGAIVGYDRLLIATGTRARPWPNAAEACHCFTLRTRDDADRLRAFLAAKPRRVVIIGGGFIGCEVASCCIDLGIAATVVVRAPVPLGHAVGLPLGTFVADVMRRKGVDLRMPDEVAAIEGDIGGRVEAVALRSGERLAADGVVIALGAERNVAWLQGSGLHFSEKGVRVDASCRALLQDGSSAPGVYAAGDVAQWPSRRCGGRLLAVEHWGNAVAQAEVAAHNLAAVDGTQVVHDHIPDFWSQQFGLTIKLIGVPDRADQFAVVQGSPEERRFIGVYGEKGRTVAAVSVDAARWLPAYRAAVARGAPFPPITGALDQNAIRVERVDLHVPGAPSSFEGAQP